MDESFVNRVEGGLDGSGQRKIAGGKLAVDELGQRKERAADADLFDDFLGEAVERSARRRRGSRRTRWLAEKAPEVPPRFGLGIAGDG